MPQTAIIQPATPKGPPQTRTAGTPGKKEQNGFSPHLDKAVTNTKKQQQANRDESRTTASAKTDKKTSSQYRSPSPKSQGTGNSPDDTLTANTVNNPDGTDATPEQLSGPIFDAEPPEEEFSTTAFSQRQQIEPSAQQFQNITNTSSDENVLQKTMLAELTPAIAEPIGDNATQPTTMSTVFSPAIAEPIDDNATQPTTMSAVLLPAIAEPIDDNATQPTTMSTVLLPAIAEPIDDNATQPTTMSAVLLPAITEPIGDNAIKPTTMSAVLSSAITEPIGDTAIKPAAAKESNIFIDQLQRIIDQADETGTVSITKAAGTTPVDSIRSNFHGVLLPQPIENSAQVLVPATAGSSAAAVSDLFIVDADGAEKAIAKPTEQITGLRQDSQQQYFNPKIAAKNLGDANQNPQEHRRGDDLPQQGMGTGPQAGQVSGLSSGTEQSNTFSQMVTTSQPTTTPTTTPSAGTTTSTTFLPSGVPVQESEIMQQLSNRLQLSSKNMDTRINLKLHPVELGSLKIDLTVKEGSIRANVVAQSQHTSEILEKNMTKLKSILENQGFTVDEISVTAESDSVNDFNLFDGQLFGQNDYAPKTRKGRREDEPVFTLANNVFAAPAMSTGVNVKI